MDIDNGNGLIKRATRADAQRSWSEAVNGGAVKWAEMRIETER